MRKKTIVTIFFLLLITNASFANIRIHEAFLSELEFESITAFSDEKVQPVKMQICVDPIFKTKKISVYETNTAGVPQKKIGELFDDGKYQNGDDLWGDGWYSGVLQVPISNKVGEYYYRAFLNDKQLSIGSDITEFEVIRRVPVAEFAKADRIVKNTIRTVVSNSDGGLTKEQFEKYKYQIILELKKLPEVEKVVYDGQDYELIAVEMKSGADVHIFYSHPEGYRGK